MRLPAVRPVLLRAAASLRAGDALIAVALGVLCLLFMGAPLLPGHSAPASIWREPLLYNILQFGVPLVLALRLADAVAEQGTPGWLSYAWVPPLVVGAGVWLIGPALVPWLGGDPHWGPLNDLSLAVGIGVLFGLLVAGHARWRGGQRTQRLARSAEAARAEQARQLQAAHLLALQARVEPQLLFDALGRVAERIPADLHAADALLADTIALLRALLPGERGESSTLGRELMLLRLRGRVTGEPALAPDALLIEADPALDAVLLAPTLLPEIVRSLGAAAPGWRLAARASAGRVVLELGPLPHAAPESARAALTALPRTRLAERLEAVHGASSRLVVETTPTPRLQLEWPLVVSEPEPHRTASPITPAS